MSGTSLKLCRSSKYVFNGSRIRRFSDKRPTIAPPPEKPESSDWRALGDDVKASMGLPTSSTVVPERCDVAIVGGGIIGSSIAYWLKRRVGDALSVVIVEKDPTYTKASTPLSCGGLRQQFTVEENVQLSLFGAEFLRDIEKYLAIPGNDVPDVQFNKCGYLFLATEEHAAQLETNHNIQRKMGAKVELLSHDKLKEKFPWMNLEGIVLGNHGVENEGWLDPWSLLGAYKRKAMSLGTTYVKGDVVSFEYKKAQDAQRGTYENPDKILVKTDDGETKPIQFDKVIIACGAYSGKVAKLAQIGTGPGDLSVPLPIGPRKRYVYVYRCPDGPGMSTPYLIDSTGMYFRREGGAGTYLCGLSPPLEEEPSTDDLEVDYSFFDEKVWPLLCDRAPLFECIKLTSAWAGYYDFNDFDENGVVGRHPSYDNLYIAAGFSGHGVQHSAGTGRGMSELILDGHFKSIDMKPFGFERIIKKERLVEMNII